MNAKPPSRTTTPGSPVVPRGDIRGATGRHLIRRWPCDGEDVINLTLQQVRGYRGIVHAVVRRDFDQVRGFHYVTECERMLWADKGAVLTTWPVDCPHCREMACREMALL
jgi:hypothetical protein